jgi:hypothetical protein
MLGSPSPRPSPPGRGRFVRCLSITHVPEFDERPWAPHQSAACCSLSLRERVRVRVNGAKFHPAYRTNRGTFELGEYSGKNMACFYRSADFQSAVSPICNRQSVDHSQDPQFCRGSAGYKPAIQQTTSLRYGRRRHAKQIQSRRVSKMAP